MIYSFAGVTSLPFFAMHFSNYAYLSSVLLGQAILLQTLIVRPGLEISRALFFGLLLSLLLFLSLPSVAAVAFWLCVLAALIGFSPRLASAKADRRHVIELVVGILLPVILLVLLFRNTLYFKILRSTVEKSGRALLSLDLNMSEPAGFLGLLGASSIFVLLAIAVAIGLRTMTTNINLARWNNPSLRYLRNFGLCFLIAVFVIFTLWPAPSVPNIENTDNISLLDYLAKVFGAFLSSFGLSSSDLYIVRTFWTGFGWLEWMPHGWVYHLLTTALFIGLLLLWLSLYRERGSPSRLWLIVAAVIGNGLYLALLVFGSYHQQFNLHGRYLIGFYLFTVALAGVGILQLENIFRRLIWYRMVRLLNIGLLTFILSIHSYLLGALIERYFGASL